MRLQFPQESFSWSFSNEKSPFSGPVTQPCSKDFFLHSNIIPGVHVRASLLGYKPQKGIDYVFLPCNPNALTHIRYTYNTNLIE